MIVCHFYIFFGEDFAFRCVIHFELIFAYDVSYRLRLIFLYTCPYVSCWKYYFSALIGIYNFMKINWPYICVHGSIFRLCITFYSRMYLSFCQFCPDCHSFILRLEINSMNSSTFFFLKKLLGYSRFFY